MSSVLKNSRAGKNLAALLTAQGFIPGVPEHISQATQQIDRDIVQRARCGGCGQRKLSYNPYRHISAPRYRVVGICSQCNRAETF